MRLTALLILSALLATAALILTRSPWGYATQDRDQISATSTHEHRVGTDELGRDRSVRLAGALLLGMAGSVAASALASSLSVGLGALAAFAAPWIGRTLLYLADLFLTLPWLFLLLMVRSTLPLTLPPLRSAAITFLLLGLLGAPAFLRLHYTRIRHLRRSEWLLLARAAGLRPPQLLRQVLPHLRPLLLTQFLLYIPACVIAEANLGTMGLGVSEPLPSWGSMLQSLQSAALLNTSRLVYLPMLLLVVVLILLELLAFQTPETAP